MHLDILNDKLVLVPLAFAQSLYDTSSVDRLTVLLHETEQTEPIRTALLQAFAQRELDVEIRTWQELSPL